MLTKTKILGIKNIGKNHLYTKFWKEKKILNDLVTKFKQSYTKFWKKKLFRFGSVTQLIKRVSKINDRIEKTNLNGRVTNNSQI